MSVNPAMSEKVEEKKTHICTSAPLEKFHLGAFVLGVGDSLLSHGDMLVFAGDLLLFYGVLVNSVGYLLPSGGASWTYHYYQSLF